MVKDQVQQTIYSVLSDYLQENDIDCVIDANRVKYILKSKDFLLEIAFDFMDAFYTVRLENWHHNALDTVIHLSKCKKFEADLRKVIKREKKNLKSFQTHVYAVMLLIKQELDEKEKLLAWEQIYVANSKFDGIFVK